MLCLLDSCQIPLIRCNKNLFFSLLLSSSLSMCLKFLFSCRFVPCSQCGDRNIDYVDTSFWHKKNASFTVYLFHWEAFFVLLFSFCFYHLIIIVWMASSSIRMYIEREVHKKRNSIYNLLSHSFIQFIDKINQWTVNGIVLIN